MYLFPVDFDSFSRILNRPGGFREPGEPEEYCRGFQVFDKDMTGFIGVGQMRYILTNLGEKMSDEEVDELLKAVDTSSGEICYTGMSVFLSPSSSSSSRALLFSWLSLFWAGRDGDGRAWFGCFGSRSLWLTYGVYVDLVRTILQN